MRHTIMFAAAFLGLASWAAAQEEEVTKKAASKADASLKKTYEIPAEEKAALEKPTKKKEGVKKPVEIPQKEPGGKHEIPDNATIVHLLIAEKHAAGEVAIWNDSEHLFVEYRTSGRGAIHRTRLDVALDWEEIPQTKKGNPIVGKFEFRDKHGKEGVTEVLYEIPLADNGWSFGDIVYVAAHARVSQMMKDGSISKEHAWGDGEEFPGTKWAMYIPYRIEEPITKKPGTPPSKEIEKPTPKEDVEEGEPTEVNPGPGFPSDDDPDPAEETDPGPPPIPPTEDDPDPPEEV